MVYREELHKGEDCFLVYQLLYWSRSLTINPE